MSLTNNDRAADVLTGVYGKDVIALDYRRPGFKISRETADAIAAHPEARALLLEKHGTICWGASVREAYDATLELITRAEDAIAERMRGRRVFGGLRVPALEPAARRAAVLELTPRLRGRLSQPRRVILGFDDSERVTEFASSVEAPALSQVRRHRSIAVCHVVGHAGDRDRIDAPRNRMEHGRCVRDRNEL